MLFPTITFAVFFAIVLPASWLLLPLGRQKSSRNQILRLPWKLFILVASLFFLGWNSPDLLSLGPIKIKTYVVLILCSIAFNGIWAHLIFRASTLRSRRVVLIVGVVANIAFLSWYKYVEFFSTSVNSMADAIGLQDPLPELRTLLPIAISFYTFQAISYLVDIFRQEIRPVKILDFAVFLTFFPHSISGPIVRASEFVPQLQNRPDARYVQATRGGGLILIGLFKKLVIAEAVRVGLADPLFNAPDIAGPFATVLGVLAYAIQIYCDFSGYTDMAIGLALLLGFRFPQNFNAPYTAVSIQDFWHRWHITLSRWLRDYLYIPLGGNRRVYVPFKGWIRTSGPSSEGVKGAVTDTKTDTRTLVLLNLVATMVLGGLWHGAAWTFVVWGALHGAYLAGEQLWERNRARFGITFKDTPMWRGLRRVWTLNLVCIAWIFFRSDDIGQAWRITLNYLLAIPNMLIEHDLALPALGISVTIAIIAIGVSLAGQYVPRTFGNNLVLTIGSWSPIVQGVLFGLALVPIDALGPIGVPNFIYYRF